MADLDMLRGPVGAVLFMQSGMYVMDTTSTLLSSPWTIENVGADQNKADSAKELCIHALAVSGVYDGISAIIAKSWWPILGWGANAAYLWWLYDRAIQKAQAAGPSAWTD